MKSKLRQFHSIQPDFVFINHGRNDMENPKAGDISNRVTLPPDIRGLTVAVIFAGEKMSYGVARCEWKYPFNRKLARTVAIGRAKQAMANPPSDDLWYKQGIIKSPVPVKDRKMQFELASGVTDGLTVRLFERADERQQKILDATSRIAVE